MHCVLSLLCVIRFLIEYNSALAGCIHLTASYNKWVNESVESCSIGPETFALAAAFVPESIMIYRRPGFLAVLWFGSSPIPFPLLLPWDGQVVYLSQSSCMSPHVLTDRKKGGGEGWARNFEKPNHTTTRKPSINHSILSDLYYKYRPFSWDRRNHKAGWIPSL